MLTNIVLMISKHQEYVEYLDIIYQEYVEYLYIIYQENVEYLYIIYQEYVEYLDIIHQVQGYASTLKVRGGCFI